MCVPHVWLVMDLWQKLSPNHKTMAMPYHDISLGHSDRNFQDHLGAKREIMVSTLNATREFSEEQLARARICCITVSSHLQRT